MTEADMVKLLGRPLTSTESQNFDEYLEIAEELLIDVLCYDPFQPNDSGDEPETRYFMSRDGYSTVFIDVFTDVSSVRVDGEAVTDYTVYQWDRRNGSWFNSLVFDNRFTSDVEVEVVADWGFTELPLDLQRLLAQYFALVSSGAKVSDNIQSKRVEDFSVTYANTDQTKSEQIEYAFNSTIRKYSNCNLGNLKHGSTCGVCHRYYSGVRCGRCV